MCLAFLVVVILQQLAIAVVGADLANTRSEFSALVEGGTYKKVHDTVAIILTSRDPDIVCANLASTRINLFESSPVDVLLFATGARAAVVGLANCSRKVPFVHVVDLKRNAGQLGWTIPPHVRDQSLWSGRWPEDYRIMGHWRLSAQFHIAQMLGYEQVLQVDDDSEFPDRIHSNIFAEFKARGLKMAARIITRDPPSVTLGLPELARFFMVLEGQNMTKLHEHCSPKNESGLTSTGWDRQAMYGNFVVYSVAFISEPVVQRFIKLAIRSGGAVRHRWNEQAVFGMVWQLFVDENEFQVYDFPYKHNGVSITG